MDPLMIGWLIVSVCVGAMAYYMMCEENFETEEKNK